MAVQATKDRVAASRRMNARARAKRTRESMVSPFGGGFALFYAACMKKSLSSLVDGRAKSKKALARHADL